jgi:hypothetical protein
MSKVRDITRRAAALGVDPSVLNRVVFTYGIDKTNRALDAIEQRMERNRNLRDAHVRERQILVDMLGEDVL